jgi:hypothetical protein
MRPVVTGLNRNFDGKAWYSGLFEGDQLSTGGYQGCLVKTCQVVQLAA